MPDFVELVRAGGLLMLFLIIFAESGMMVGFFFPGDTLLFSAGILAASGVLPIWWTIAVIAAAAIIGDNMVLQQKQTNPIWGWDAPGTKVTVKFGAQTTESASAKRA